MNKTASNIAKKINRNAYSITANEVIMHQQEITEKEFEQIFKGVVQAIIDGYSDAAKWLSEHNIQRKPTRKSLKKKDK